MLQKQLDSVTPGVFHVQSAGTHAMVGHPIEESAAERLVSSGGEASDFGARQLSEGILAEVDVVLAMTEEHRTAVASMSPRMLKRAFTIREFAAIITEVEADPSIEIPYGCDAATVSERWDQLRKVAVLKRHTARTRLNGVLDVEDPFRRGDAAFDAMVDDIKPLLEVIMRFESNHCRFT